MAKRKTYRTGPSGAHMTGFAQAAKVAEPKLTGDCYSINVNDLLVPGYGNAEKIHKRKPAAYELAYRNQNKPWAKRWFREHGLK